MILAADSPAMSMFHRYNEVCNPGYDFKGTNSFGAAHFMQVVWTSSTRFGIGKATTTLDNMLCTWVVALYEPSGLMRNMQKENVLFGLFDYRYCDTFGKGGGGKGASSGTMHSLTDSKISAPNAANQPAGKRMLLSRIPASIGNDASSVATTGGREDQKIEASSDHIMNYNAKKGAIKSHFGTKKKIRKSNHQTRIKRRKRKHRKQRKHRYKQHQHRHNLQHKRHHQRTKSYKKSSSRNR